ncbi:hypothetical protein DMC30DRAFT_399992 [Rhodotorula diobovata]|uniref:Uncharacterized protein n=1 Tax=Rhodotorula diobovata TaxID=5288 RepID=A0A5C5FTJ0_9BASI|nr:hypothetical protein DMC30DRAFT_399992 [Rhodotorula diobovata]
MRPTATRLALPRPPSEAQRRAKSSMGPLLPPTTLTTPAQEPRLTQITQAPPSARSSPSSAVSPSPPLSPPTSPPLTDPRPLPRLRAPSRHRRLLRHEAAQPRKGTGPVRRPQGQDWRAVADAGRCALSVASRCCRGATGHGAVELTRHPQMRHAQARRSSDAGAQGDPRR